MPGHPEKSLLYEKVRDGIMPPGKKDRLSEAEVEIIRHWIEKGARARLPGQPRQSTVTQHEVIPILLRRCTAFGRVKVHQIALAADSLLTGRCDAARRQTGCLRFCYLPFESATPARYRCQPDLVRADCRRRLAQGSPRVDPDSPEGAAQVQAEASRVVPAFATRRYGSPYYAALHSGVAPEVPPLGLVVMFSGCSGIPAVAATGAACAAA